ncbi:pyridoxal phosphate-dependent aminotransferase family protein [bacterium]|nr:pyridoxal phosphate-dependent aminotransferase family protein [bacterium]MBU1983798.1 pyridoxal phosphate-dependent aminotransferase family protein [bacterium]
MRIAEKVARFQTARQVRAAGVYPYFRAIESDQDTMVKMHGQDVLMLGSNNYLGLTNHPKVKEAAIAAVRLFGSGCAGSRFLNGTLAIHVECEERLAEYIQKEAVLLFSTGFQANLGAIATLVQRNGFVVTDSLDHASIIDGARLSFGKMVKFRHNDERDLDRVLTGLGDKPKLVVTEGVFSMEGDIVRLPQILEVCERHGADLLLDDAHGIGVLGPQGRGTAPHYGLNDQVELIVGTFSKSLASIGGFVAASEDVIEYLKHHSRALIFSASPPPASVAAVIAALEIITAEPERRDLLWRNTRYLREGLNTLGLDTGVSETPIIPVVIGDEMLAFQVTTTMQQEGVFINPVVPPAVQPGQSLIRFSVMSTHTLEQLDFALDKMAKIVRRFHLHGGAAHRDSNSARSHTPGSEGLPSLPVASAGTGPGLDPAAPD